MTGPAPRSITWTFLAPSLSRPAGGLIALFELANALARQGGHRVQVVHIPTAEARLRTLRDLPWMHFDPSVEHHFAASLDPDELPAADVVLYTTMLLAAALASDGDARGRQLVDALAGGCAARGWLPVLFLQGSGVFPPEIEALATHLPGPKVCVGAWLAERLVQQGVPAADVAHIPNGVDPDRFHITRPVATRAPRVAMNYDPHPVKGGDTGLTAVGLAHRQLGLPATVFGTRAPVQPLPPGVDHVLAPSQDVIAQHIYNRSSMFLQPGVQEGFGMCAVESMACGCALVTTANGGAADYAFDGETALVCGGEAAEMADALGRLVHDDALRVRIATNGSQLVARFRWSTSADRLAQLVTPRLARGVVER